MTGEFIVGTIQEHCEIPKADQIVYSNLYGETLIIRKDSYPIGTRGIIIDCESKLDPQICYELNLNRKSSLNKDKEKEGYISNYRIRPIRLKGVRCTALFLSFKELSKVEGLEDIQSLDDGFQANSFNDVEICEKYVPKSNQTQGSGKKQKEGRVSMKDLTPTFKEHFDTDHWSRNKNKISNGDLVTITEKLHGTSFRCGRLLTTEPLKGFQKLWNKVAINPIKPNKDYKFVVGSRRTVKSIDGNERKEAKHYYDSDLWTDICSKHFKGKLDKGETIYGEIVGYSPQGSPIMGTHSNEKLKKFMSKKEYKKFIKDYGEKTIFNYGCSPDEVITQEYRMPEYEVTVNPVRGNPNGIRKVRPAQERSYIFPQNKVFVYRITRTNEDGETIDLSWAQVKQRCDILGVPHVPELTANVFDEMDMLEELDEAVQWFTDSKSTKFPQHLKEGVCIRVENGSLTPLVMKNKNYYFRVLEGQITEPTMEDDN